VTGFFSISLLLNVFGDGERDHSDHSGRLRMALA